MQKKYSGKGLQVVAFTKADRDEALAFARELKLNYPVRPGAKAEFRAFGISIAPAAKLIDPNGNVVADSRRMGALSSDSGEIDEILARELGG